MTRKCLMLTLQAILTDDPQKLIRKLLVLHET